MMTPELPRAPIREPWVMAPAIASMSASAGRAESSLVTEASVSDMLVPVSPSGTGKTLSLLISLGLVGNGSRSDRKTGANGLCNHGYLNLRFRMLVQTALERVDMDADLKAGGIDLSDFLQGEGNGARKIVADGLHVDAVLEHDVKIDREAVLVGGDKHALAEALTGKQAHALGALELLSHTDDAIARHRGITGNIGNNVVRDAQAAVNGLRHKNLLYLVLAAPCRGSNHRNILQRPRHVEVVGRGITSSTRNVDMATFESIGRGMKNPPHKRRVLQPGSPGRTRTYNSAVNSRVLSTIELPRNLKAQRNGLKILAPRVGLEPTTARLTAACSTD